MSIVRNISQQRDDMRKPATHILTGVMQLVLGASLLCAVVSPLSAQPGKVKETTTKPSTVAELKPDTTKASSSTTKASADPVICVKPSDAQASPAAGDDKTSASSSASAPASDNDAATESGDKSSADFMKDKLKLSLGGKSGSASDQPQQCGIDETESQAKESAPSK